MKEESHRQEEAGELGEQMGQGAGANVWCARGAPEGITGSPSAPRKSARAEGCCSPPAPSRLHLFFFSPFSSFFLDSGVLPGTAFDALPPSPGGPGLALEMATF